LEYNLTDKQSQIYNVHESGPPNIITEKGSKKVCYQVLERRNK